MFAFSHQCRARLLPLLVALLLTLSSFTLAQTPDEPKLEPIFVTARVFQLKAKRGSYGDLNTQVFRMKTESLRTNEQWLNAFKKTYAGFDVALLRTESRKVFRTSKPTIILLSRQPDGRSIQIDLYGAHGAGEDGKPSTSLIPELSMHFGNDETFKPVTLSIQPLDVTSGMTYFFATSNLKFDAKDYVRFLRVNTPPEPFADDDVYLVFAFSVDLQKSDQPPRYLDERQSLAFQESATKKVQPEVAAALRDAGLGGFIRVRVVVGTDGKVTDAAIYSSSFPELNDAAVTTARQWEFPTTHFASDKRPVTGFVTFNLTPQPAKKPAADRTK